MTIAKSDALNRRLARIAEALGRDKAPVLMDRRGVADAHGGAFIAYGGRRYVLTPEAQAALNGQGVEVVHFQPLKKTPLPASGHAEICPDKPIDAGIFQGITKRPGA